MLPALTCSRMAWGRVNRARDRVTAASGEAELAATWVAEQPEAFMSWAMARAFSTGVKSSRWQLATSWV